LRACEALSYGRHNFLDGCKSVTRLNEISTSEKNCFSN
jgi:hypothetical protein